ncbi:FMN reductase [Streptomyces sp. TP-A0356]|uniref:FMN reductase n=1 Tax=Streptomyces sp. TP-A0356 TaxID=1359208 RepID=UPI0006E3F9E4|nr:FMN reductase [Streptomyces sp. TP-A0356]
MKLVVVSAGLSVPSSTRLVADRLAAAVDRRTPVDIQVVELRDLAVEIAHNFTNGFPGRALAGALEAVTEADGLIVVTPVFTASYSGLFKSFFDVLDKEALVGTPVLIAATGGTARHSLVLEHALRPLFSYLRATVVPTGVYAASEDWGAEGLTGRVERAAAELAGLMASGSVREPAESVREPEESVREPAGRATEPAGSVREKGVREGVVRAGRVREGAVPEAAGLMPGAAEAERVSVPDGVGATVSHGFRVIPFEEQLAALRK